MIRLNDLNNFIEVSAFSSLSLAAKKIDVTQPALSESIGRLEKDLGLKLFYRTKNGISLTPEGKKTLDQAKHIQNLLLGLAGQTSEIIPSVTLGCHLAVAAYFIPSFYKSLDQHLPGHRVQLKHDLSRNIQQEIQAGKIDFGIVVNPISNPDLIIKKINEDHVCVWKSKKKKTPDKIIADTNLLQTQNILKKWKTAPKKVLNIESLDLIARMTDAGCGYGIIPEKTVQLLKLDLIQVENTPIYHDQFFLVHRPEFGKNSYEKELLKCLNLSFN